MSENYANEDFLVRWMAGELSQEELEGFEASDLYRQLMAIDKAAETLHGPEIDVEKALALVTQKNLSVKKEPKVKQLWWLPALAASIALLFGLYSYFFGYKTYETGIGESEIVLLADGSTIEMNANSKLSFKRFGWSEDRVVDFEGEAFFDVQPGNDFTVNIPSGTISVVGTQFNVRDRNNLKVQCYEGSIVFTSNREQTPIQLSQGMELHFLGGEMLHKQFEGAKPDWTHGFSTFNEQPFNEVLDELALQFPITFKLDSINTDRLFTGRFSYHNLEDALKTTMEPMGITYVISEDKRIVTLSK